MKIFAVALSMASFAGAQGIVVYKPGAALEFSPAISIRLNGKDKASGMGQRPAFTGPANKLPSVRLAGTLLRDEGSNTVIVYSAGQAPQFLLPADLPKTAPAQPGEIWKIAAFDYKKSQAEKTPVALPAPQFVAYLPDGVAGLAALCRDEAALAHLGGERGYFAAQLELLSAAVKAHGADPAMAAVEGYVRETMADRLSRFDNGIESAKSLEEGLQFAKLSQQSYPDRAEHGKLRDALSTRKGWLDRRLAILRALSAGGEPDAFLVAYRDFEKHQLSYPDMVERRKASLENSLKVHWAAGKQRMADREYKAAWRELRLASFRNPENAGLQKDIGMAWTEYSREVAVSRRGNRPQLTLGQQESISQSLFFATKYKEQGKLDDALKSVLETEAIDKHNLAVLLKKAEILGARNELARALEALDEYDQNAVDEERAAASKLRNEFSFQLTNVLREQKKALEGAWTANRFHATRRLASQVLKVDERDPDVLYYAGLSALVTRDSKAGRAYLERYLQASDTLGANAARRSAVLRLLSGIPEAQAPQTQQGGEANWYSGALLPAGVYYCPLSLAFSPKIESIKASNKLTVRFGWERDRLKAVVPVFEKTPPPTNEEPISFTYESRIPQVVAAHASESPGQTASDPDELLKQSTVILANNPVVDPLAVERLTGRRITTAVAGNRFFHPFVWERPYRFELTYDTAGRVASARELTDEARSSSATTLYFEWDGMRLTSIKGYQGAAPGGGRGSLVYERRQQYQDNRLVSEDIRAGARSSQIKYTYAGTTLVSAECEKDETLDSRSREVTFLAAAGARPRR